MKYNIWMSGYAVTGNSAPAEFLGTYEADSFEVACRIAAKATGQLEDYSDSYLLQTDEGVKRIPQRPAIWGRGLYDNEAKARKTFG
jgi:hypothetical protein